MISCAHLREYVVRPALYKLGDHARDGEELVIATAVQESRLRYLHQQGGPALGLWQMEPATAFDILNRFVNTRPVLKAVLESFVIPGMSITDQLPGNLLLGAALCRARYMYDPAPLPPFTDVLAMAQYWKRVYNGPGRGTVGEFVAAYHSIVTP